MAAGEFSRLFVSHWRELQEKLRSQDEEILLDGRSLSLAAVVACARYGQEAIVSPDVLEQIARNTEIAYGKLSESETASGRHASIGSSSSVRSAANEQMQRRTIRSLHYGILSGETDFDISNVTRTFSSAIPLSDPVESTSMPESWVRATIVVLTNSISYPNTGIRPVVLRRLLSLLNLDVIPRIPIRGSTGAGDFSPLSYISGILQGKPALQAWVGDRIQGGRKLVPGDEALSYAEIEALDIRAREGFAVVSSTAPSAAIASLALHETMCLAAVSQVLTAMAAETLFASDANFSELISEVRPHPGQSECAQNLRKFVEGSKLTIKDTGSDQIIMREDRYAVRTSPQWIGPVLEDLLLAHAQISLEINSATDPVVVDPKSSKMLHGGNLQAKSVTSAMEKARQSCQSLGQILFAQCTEIINSATSKGLAPNLAVEEPSQSGPFKGIDFCIAALQSELSFLANPVGSHVQFAETGIQAINSLAMISARYTLTSVDVLTQLAAAHLIALCEALDLRAFHMQFLYALAPKFKLLTRRCLSDCIEAISPGSDGGGSEIAYDLWIHLCEGINKQAHMDSVERFQNVMDFLQTRLLRVVPMTQQSLEAVQQWNVDCAREATQTYHSVKSRYLASPDASPVLGRASKRMYIYLRRKLEIPFFGDDYLRAAEWDDGTRRESQLKYRSVGAIISAVYEAMRNGALYAEVVHCFQEV